MKLENFDDIDGIVWMKSSNHKCHIDQDSI